MTGAWWNDRPLSPGSGWRLSLGPLVLSVTRGEREIRVVEASQEEAGEGAVVEVDQVEAPDGATVTRYPTGTGRTLRLEPRLADRSVVVRPETPIAVMPGEVASLYVSSPIWVAVAVDGVVLQEVPTLRPSDTWYGPSTRVGVLCYAIRTAARLNPGRVPQTAGRAVTELRVTNGGSTPLPIDRIRVPVPSLALYADGPVLVTDRVDVRASDGEIADVEVVSRGGGPLAVPRRAETGGMWVRALQLVKGVG